MVIQPPTEESEDIRSVKFGLLMMFVFIILIGFSVLFTGIPQTPVLALMTIGVFVVYTALAKAQRFFLGGTPGQNMQELFAFSIIAPLIVLGVSVVNAFRYTLQTWNDVGLVFVICLVVWAFVQYIWQNGKPMSERTEWKYTDPLVVLGGLFVLNGVFYTLTTMDWGGFFALVLISEGLAVALVRKLNSR